MDTSPLPRVKNDDLFAERFKERIEIVLRPQVEIDVQEVRRGRLVLPLEHGGISGRSSLRRHRSILRDASPGGTQGGCYRRQWRCTSSATADRRRGNAGSTGTPPWRSLTTFAERCIPTSQKRCWRVASAGRFSLHRRRRGDEAVTPSSGIPRRIRFITNEGRWSSRTLTSPSSSSKHRGSEPDNGLDGWRCRGSLSSPEATLEE